MDIGASFIADPQPSELVQPRDGALDHPAEATEARVACDVRSPHEHRWVGTCVPESR